jgi:hypothetical protein
VGHLPSHESGFYEIIFVFLLEADIRDGYVSLIVIFVVVHKTKHEVITLTQCFTFLQLLFTFMVVHHWAIVALDETTASPSVGLRVLSGIPEDSERKQFG